MSPSKKSEKFYKDGLCFECTGCGNCCSHPDGTVMLTSEEAGAIADYLEMDEAGFLEKYLDISPGVNGLHLTSYDNGDCIFLENNQCQIYPVRPMQCRTFPFWPENLKSAFRWKQTAHQCPGINLGRRHSKAEIDTLLSRMERYFREE